MKKLTKKNKTEVESINWKLIKIKTKLKLNLI